MAAVRAQIDGYDKVTRAASLFGKRAVAELGAALYRQAEQIMTAAKLETPVDTGNLRASGHVQAPIREGQQVSVAEGFGGVAAPYAVIVHENLEAHHPVGKAKFLEDPYRAKLGTIVNDLAADLEATLLRKAA